jgi:hypothetical protein
MSFFKKNVILILEVKVDDQERDDEIKGFRK